MSRALDLRQALWRPGPAESGRKAVLAAAAEVFDTYGYLATSMDMIADRLGATKGRVYHYYRGKPEIFLDVVEQGMHELLAMIEPLVAESTLTAPKRLHRMIQHHAKAMMEESPPQAVAVQMVQYRRIPELASHAEVVKRIVGLRRQYSDYFETVLRDGVDTGELCSQDVDLAVKSLLGALNWIPVWFRSEDEESDAELDRVATFYADTHLRAFLSKGS